MTNSQDFRAAYEELSPIGRAATMRYLSSQMYGSLNALVSFHNRRKVTIEQAIQVHGAHLIQIADSLAALQLALAIEQEEKIDE